MTRHTTPHTLDHECPYIINKLFKLLGYITKNTFLMFMAKFLDTYRIISATMFLGKCNWSLDSSMRFNKKNWFYKKKLLLCMTTNNIAKICTRSTPSHSKTSGYSRLGCGDHQNHNRLYVAIPHLVSQQNCPSRKTCVNISE